MRSRRWKFAASLGLLLCLSASIAVGGFAADASVAEQGYPGGGDWGRPSQAYGYAPWGSVKHNGHYYFEDGWKKEAAATCVSAEKWVNKCVWTYWDGSQCGEEWVEWWGKKDPNNHVNTETRNQKKATCTEEGYTGDLYCKDCNKRLQKGETIPKTDHKWDNGVVTTPATCTEDGVRTYTCKRCKTTRTEPIDKTGHDPIAVPGKEPTCTETGLTEGSKCQRCGKTLTAQETIPALGHDWNTTSTGVDNCVNVSFRHENETITLCPICGVQNGTQRLNKVTLYTAHAKLVVLRGVLENGMEAMTVAFYEPGISSVTACQRCGAVRDSFSSGASLPQAAENAHFTVDASLVDGYTVMLVQADGTETVLTPGISNGKAIFDVDMKGQGARLLHLVPTTAA